jgi:cytochrome c oxidase cbb3-type subunit 3/ubiquinol-cytochrome c reductase cytochrome c subunit
MNKTSLLTAFALAAFAGCGDHALNGQPSAEPEVPDPRTVVSFAPLYNLNCAGCHGERGQGGAAVGLASPAYLAYAPDDAIRDVIANGRPGTTMPAFARSAGGMLTDAQIAALQNGIRGWADGARPEADPPPYQPTVAGDGLRGAEVFRAHCASCHGNHGHGGRGGSSVTDGAFLALVSDQSLRTTIVAGRPDLGSPDYRTAGGSPMSAQDVSDTVAWLAAQRVAVPGQPYPTAAADGSKR